MRRKLVIVGAGPAGLSLARALTGSGAEVVLVDRQPLESLADPRPDGREIALTQASIRHLRELDVWPMIPPDEIHPLREARVLNGISPLAMFIKAPRRRGCDLGVLVSNHVIRQALYRAVEPDPQVTLLTGRDVRRVRADADRVTIDLEDGEEVSGDLLVAADSRFSTTRAALGIGAEMIPVGKTMLVCRVHHALPHHSIATEWFDHGRTVAMLPLASGQSSIVLTLPDSEARELAATPIERLGPRLADLTRSRWGAMEAIGPAIAYPLTITYAHRFAAPRAALLGDAAVGMHPVTAHGFNFGLAGSMRLAKLLRDAPDVGEARRLMRYALAHRATTRPLYLATLALVRLFTDDRRPARAARAATLRIGALTPIRQALGALLMERSPA